MIITQAVLENKINQLRAMKDQHLANANAAQGAILLCQGLIADLQVPEVEDPPTPA